nr:Crp/Fnr family transcriptional regulator [uncultured Psychroserpens sp.]
MSKCEQCLARQFNAMKSMTHEELKRVSACKTNRFYKKGEVIFDEGEALNGVFCISSGVSKLTKLSANGKDHTVKLLSKGSLIGQRAMISDQRANLSAIAITDVELCFVPKDEIVNTLHDNNDFSFDLMKAFAKELKHSEDNLVNMAQKTVKNRLAEALIYIHDNFGVDDLGYLKVVISREDYANIVGTATESAIRILSQFKKDGLISMKGKAIKIENLQKLKFIE